MLKYPLDLSERDNDYVVITSHEYRTNKKYAGGISGTAPAINKYVFYMPNSTPAMNNGNAWTANSNAGPLGMAMRNLATGTAGSISTLVENIPNMSQGNFGNMDSIVANVKSQFEAIKDNALPAGEQLVLNFIGEFANLSASNIRAITRGEVYNPNTELLYESPGLRSFGLSFNMIPKNQLEANRINEIIMSLKQDSSAEEVARSGMLKLPYVFQVKYMSGAGQNKHMNAFKKAALTNLVVQHNASADMHASFSDGMPISTTLTMSFQEVDIILKGDHAKSGSLIGY